MWKEGEIYSSKNFEEMIRKILITDSESQQETGLEKIKAYRNESKCAKEHNLLIRNILLRGVRKFPGGKDFYCLQLGKHNDNDNESCSSVVYIGSNGVGKSSIFYAIEKAALGYARSMINDKRNITQEEKYLKHFSSPENSEHFNIFINCCGGLNLRKKNLTESKDYTTPIFFVSNQDIERLINEQYNQPNGKDAPERAFEKSNLRYILEHTGMSNFHNFLTALKNLLQETELHHEEYSILIAKLNTLKQETTEYAEIRTSIAQLKENYPLLANEEFANEVLAIREMFKNKMTDYIETAYEICKTTFTRLFGMYCLREVIGLNVKVQDNYLIDVSLILRTKNSNMSAIDPIRYLNSFRQKMFCIIYHIALAFISMKLYRIRFPIIFDDVFNAGDFDSKDTLNMFVREIYCVYEELFPEDPVPLQLIFFTQDDLIAQTVYRGMIGEGCGEDKTESYQSVTAKLCRIVEVNEITEEDIIDPKVDSKVDNLYNTLIDEYKIDCPFSIYRIEDQIAANYE